MSTAPSDLLSSSAATWLDRSEREPAVPPALVPPRGVSRRERLAEPPAPRSSYPGCWGASSTGPSARAPAGPS
jgi:hypothetical protein